MLGVLVGGPGGGGGAFTGLRLWWCGVRLLQEHGPFCEGLGGTC